MARQESDREDLLREATALVERIEIAPRREQLGERVVAGFRRNGSLSVFFDGDPVYQFNAANELRRAFCDGLMLKAAGRRLVALERHRRSAEVVLIRRELPELQQRAFLQRMRQLLADLCDEMNRADCRIIGQSPLDADLRGRVAAWLGANPAPPIADAPHVGT